MAKRCALCGTPNLSRRDGFQYESLRGADDPREVPTGKQPQAQGSSAQGSQPTPGAAGLTSSPWFWFVAGALAHKVLKS